MVLLTDYATTYHCKFKNEIQSAFLSILTCLRVQFFIKPLQGQTFLEYLYAIKILQDESIAKEVI